jgi:hypothetical protein
MRDELDSHGQWQRLVELYRAMTDEELMQLAARPDDLTGEAQGVLCSEMGSRRLRAEAAPVAEAEHMGMAERFAAGADYYAGLRFPAVAQPEPEMRPEPAAKGLAKGMVVLTTFHDAIAAREACDLLETEGMEIEVRDAASAHGGSGSFYGGPPVALQVIVQQRELGRAMAILREKMGMFPLQEVEVADEAIDDGTTAVLGAFGHRSDAEDVARVLEEAGVWHRIAANEEGSVADEDAYTLEVKEVDLVRAGDVVERGLGLPEG